MLLVLLTGCATVTPPASRASVVAVDEQQRAMVALRMWQGWRDLLTPIYASTHRWSGADARAIPGHMRSGEIAAEGFDRTAEDVSVSANVAVVMGRETFTPAQAVNLENLRPWAAPAALH